MDVLSDAVAAIRVGQPHASQTRRIAPWDMRLPGSTAAGFHVVLAGECQLEPPAGPSIPLGAGDVVFVPHGCAHRLHAMASHAGAETQLLCGGYVLERKRAHPLLRELPDVIHLQAGIGGDTSLRSIVDLLTCELEQRRQGTDALIPAVLDALLVIVLRAWFTDPRYHHAGAGWATALNDRAIIAAVHAIHREPAQPWTVAQLGVLGGLSRAAFARRFAGAVGQPPLAYLTWWRMTTAARLLRDSSAALSAVAEQVGYGSEFAFARAFKRELGTAPGEYRRRLRA